MDAGGALVAFELDLTAAYPAEAQLGAFFRRFEWRCDPMSGRASLSLTDRFEFSLPTEGGDGNSVTEHFMSVYEPVVGEGEAVWRGGARDGMLALRCNPVRSPNGGDRYVQARRPADHGIPAQAACGTPAAAVRLQLRDRLHLVRLTRGSAGVRQDLNIAALVFVCEL
ncbi:hypothetical protein [Cohnella rhizosphaerae]|uniref:Uncharacterized protein n=1 Tax=Cohnella rhizosphaerae TaxID=1457232 RepID=A0A9X4KS87_9BACL|nr:hypothetical protein [Cohnella rhizosphaerae]MDG0809970.1 hypothetical protein [Cohnella rhizosphaerae]